MTLAVSTTLRPGLLVSMKTAIDGNVEYDRVDIVEDHVTADGMRVAEWKTERTVIDAAEHEKAVTLRAKARSLITSICSRSDFGLLCPDNKVEELEKAVREARALCDEFNSTARLTEVTFNILTGKIAADDAMAVRAINQEVRGLFDEMREGIKRLDVKAVRDAAAKAKQLGSMLAPDAQTRLDDTIKAVRAEASKIVKAGETAAGEVDEAVLTKLAQARTAFLDFDGADEITVTAGEGRALDLDPEVAAILGDEPTAAPVVEFEDEFG